MINFDKKEIRDSLTIEQIFEIKEAYGLFTEEELVDEQY